MQHTTFQVLAILIISAVAQAKTSNVRGYRQPERHLMTKKTKTKNGTKKKTSKNLENVISALATREPEPLPLEDGPVQALTPPPVEDDPVEEEEEFLYEDNAKVVEEIMEEQEEAIEIVKELMEVEDIDDEEPEMCPEYEPVDGETCISDMSCSYGLITCCGLTFDAME